MDAPDPHVSRSRFPVRLNAAWRPEPYVRTAVIALTVTAVGLWLGAAALGGLGIAASVFEPSEEWVAEATGKRDGSTAGELRRGT